MPYLDTRRIKYAEHFDWYEGRLDTLFSGVMPSQINGLENVSPAEITTRFNYFATVSRFFTDAMLADIPQIGANALALLETLTGHWAVTGEACLAQTAGRWTAIRPDYIHPIYNRFDKDIVDRFLFVYPERKENMLYPHFENTTLYADAARVIDYDVATGRAFQSVRQYRHGWVADIPVGTPVAIGPVLWLDTGDGVYNDIEGMVREITVRLNILQGTLNSTAFSILQIDKDSIADGVFLTGVTPERVRNASRNGLGMTVSPPFIGEEGARYVERTGVGLDESLEYLRLLLKQLSVITGIPEYVFGVVPSNPNETERVLFSGQAKVNRFRRDIERAFAIAGQPVRFAAEPFVTRSERIASIIQQYEKGITSLAETRQALRWGQ